MLKSKYKLNKKVVQSNGFEGMPFEPDTLTVKKNIDYQLSKRFET